MSILIYALLYMQNLVKHFTIVKNPHTYIDNILTIKFYNTLIHSNF